MRVVEAVEHMRKTHEGIADGHIASAEHHRTMSKCHGTAMGKAVAGDPQHIFHKDAKQAHDAAAEDHDSRAAYHRKMAEDCEQAKKVAGDADLSKGSSDLLKRLEVLENTVVPTQVRGIVPNAPGITAVPRAGGRPMPTEKPNVPIAFEKLVSIEE